MFEDSTAAPGAVSVYDSPIYIADAALYLMATQPELGITNPYALDQDQFDASIALLEQQEDLVGQYWSLFTDQQAGLEDGSVLTGTTWQVIVNLAQANGATIDAVKPVEGATGWSDTWMISSQAKNPNCMYMWMDHITPPRPTPRSPSTSARRRATRSVAISPLIPITAPRSTPPTPTTGPMSGTGPRRPRQCLDGRTDVACVPYTEWVNAWSQLRS